MDTLLDIGETEPKKKNSEWYTPSRYIEAARAVMGGIDLDPASCEEANKVVKADCIYTAQTNGLTRPCHGRVWLNPPYSSPDGTLGRTGSRPGSVKPFVFKLIHEYELCHIQQAILLVTSDTDAAWFVPLWQFPICFADHKVMFHRPGLPNEGQFFGTSFVYLGPYSSRFEEQFLQFGPIGYFKQRPKLVTPLPLWTPLEASQGIEEEAIA